MLSMRCGRGLIRGDGDPGRGNAAMGKDHDQVPSIMGCGIWFGMRDAGCVMRDMDR